MKMHPTKNDLKSNTKNVSIEIMNARLADAIDLALITKQAHWNLKGPQFIAIHEMLDSFREQIDIYSDMIAERAVQLGGAAFGTKEAVSEKSSLKAYPTDIFAIKDQLPALIERYATVANNTRKSIDDVDEAGDADAADILTNFSKALDKSLWFLEAHIQEKG